VGKKGIEIPRQGTYMDQNMADGPQTKKDSWDGECQGGKKKRVKTKKKDWAMGEEVYQEQKGGALTRKNTSAKL